FKLYALDQKLDAERDATKKQIEEAMKNHIIAETRLEGKYSP
ncbi:YbhB/YbcL family Raf kinase inhibitor-like protein, partial [Marine Group I thaumarchaeote]|nr:YbhB/YbcL family Raf kinase inhibitor-like protein [Marine Group I thaumarchaeote]